MITDPSPLKYIAAALAQMATTLKDFGMMECAVQLEKVKTEIDAKLAGHSDQPVVMKKTAGRE